MEGGFEAERGTARPAPGFEPPVDPGGGPSLRGLALVARIMRGRELAADAAGIPPLDSDQVLDLQRTAGNQLTTGALARWNDLLAEGTTAQAVPQELLGQLLAARAADPALHAAICAALDGLAPQVSVTVSCTGEPGGPVARSPCAVRRQPPRPSPSCSLPASRSGSRSRSRGPSARPRASRREDALAVELAPPGGASRTLELPIPFAAPGRRRATRRWPSCVRA